METEAVQRCLADIGRILLFEFIIKQRGCLKSTHMFLSKLDFYRIMLYAKWI